MEVPLYIHSIISQKIVIFTSQSAYTLLFDNDNSSITLKINAAAYILLYYNMPYMFIT
jgi:hypothetical protein